MRTLVFPITAGGLALALMASSPALAAKPATLAKDHPSTIDLSLSPQGARTAVISVPGRRPLYVASLAPQFDSGHHLIRITVILRRLGDNSGNVLDASDTSPGLQPLTFKADEFSPGVRKLPPAAHRALSLKRIRMRLMVDVMASGIRPFAKTPAAPAGFEFQTFGLRLTAADLGRRTP